MRAVVMADQPITNPTERGTTMTEYLPTGELRPGDIVSNHTMRLLIDRPITSYSDGGSTVYRTEALVTNWDEIKRDAMAGNDLACFIVARVCDRGEHWDESRKRWVRPGREDVTDPRWAIQGNDLARWATVRA